MPVRANLKISTTVDIRALGIDLWKTVALRAENKEKLGQIRNTLGNIEEKLRKSWGKLRKKERKITRGRQIK